MRVAISCVSVERRKGGEGRRGRIRVSGIEQGKEEGRAAVRLTAIARVPVPKPLQEG
jgi:hypothetical protein